MDNNRFLRVLNWVEEKTGRSLTIDQKKLEERYNHDRNQQSMTIKVLSILGGVLATLAFVVFLYLARLDRSEVAMYILSLIFFLTSLWINKKFDKVILDSISVCLFLLGYGLFSMGFYASGGSAFQTHSIFILFGIITLFLSKSYILSFLSVLIIFGSSIAVLFDLEIFDLIHAIYICIVLLFIYYTFKEGRLMKSSLLSGKQYMSIRTGLVFSYMICLYFISSPRISEGNWHFNWISSGFNIIIVNWLIHCLLKRFQCDELGKRIFIFLIVTVCLGFTAMSPAISGSLLLLLLSFKVNYKTGFALGILGFIYFLGQYYYDLDLSLLHKSISMMASGLFFLILYLMIFKKSTQHEKA